MHNEMATIRSVHLLDGEKKDIEYKYSNIHIFFYNLFSRWDFL